jgi:sugar-specific transcriptional regulator TrmB
MAEFEFGGMTFKGGKIFVLMTALSTLGGASWAGFEFYKDYMDMKEIVQNIDVDAIRQERELLQQELKGALSKVDDAIEYTRDIKTGLRDDILGIEKQADRVEDMVRATEDEVRSTIQNAEERFDQKRDALQSDYDRKASALRDNTEQKLKDLEERLSSRLQLALDNPLSN